MSLGVVTMKLLTGFWQTCLVFIVVLVLSLPLGLIVSFGSMSRFKPLKWLTKTFVWIIRGTPLMLQLIIVFYGPGIMGYDFSFSRFTAVVIAFVINYSAYLSEIYRAGIESIPKGQYEAGQVLGMTKTQIFFKVVLIQVIKRIIPPMSNEIITLVKDTALARVIALQELTMVAFSFAKANALLWPLLYSGVFYLVFNSLLSILFNWLEKKLGYFRV